MSGLFGGSKTTYGDRVGAFAVQSSSQGVGITLAWGRCRIAPNLLWMADFKAIEHKQKQGKGGGSATVSYTYEASVLLGLCAGEIVGVRRVWVDKDIHDTLAAAGFQQFASGAIGQATWGYLTTAYPDQAIGYSGIAYVAATGLGLSTTGGLNQYNFEIDARRQVSGENPDANPADICTDLLLDPIYGAAPGADWVDSFGQYRTWCAAKGLWLSPSYGEQKGVFEYIEQLGEITFSSPLWQVDQFTMVPLATEAVGGFTPLPWHSQPVYLITDDDIKEPIEETRDAPTDRYNRRSVQYSDRSQNYATAVETSEDGASIDAYGLIEDPDVYKAEEIVRQDVAAVTAELMLREGLSVLAEYRFSLPINFDLLDPLDIITIQDERIDLPPTSVRITEIQEEDDGELSIVAEDVAVTGDVTLALQPSGGFGYQPAPPDDTKIMAVILPTAATGNVQQAVIGGTAGANWTGATLWISDTGLDYRVVGEITTRARLGTLSASIAASTDDPDGANTLAVNIEGEANGMTTVQQTDVDALRTLTWVDGELLAYRDAALIASKQYALTYLRRGLYGTASAAHAAGTHWMRLDETLVTIDVPEDIIGKTVYFKATSRNLLGTYEQGLDEVEATEIVITALESLPGLPRNLALTGAFIGTSFEVNWGAAARADMYDVEVLHASVVVRNVQTSAQTFRYMYADAVDDGGAERDYTIRVRGKNAAGVGLWSVLPVSNPAPAAVTGLAAAGSGSSRTVSWTPSTAPDLAGYRAWYSTMNGFDPKVGEGTQFHDGQAASADLDGLLPSTTYYVRVAAYDVWSSAIADLNFSDEFVFSTEA